MSSHADGSYITWKSAESSEPKEAALTPYGNNSSSNQTTQKEVTVSFLQ